jgi:hypothetical protein
MRELVKDLPGLRVIYSSYADSEADVLREGK